MKREWLIKLRKEKGLKQFEMAKTLDISSNYYCEIESGKKNPRWNIAMRIATFFDVTVDNFFLQSNSRNESFRREGAFQC